MAGRFEPVRFSLGVITGDVSFNPLTSWIIPGPDDGKVGVDNARVEGAADFLVVTGHAHVHHEPDRRRGGDPSLPPGRPLLVEPAAVRAWGFWGATLAGIVATRLPYLSSPAYILDNDEAVLAIMARHLAHGSELPFYFAGQSYGLAIFETLPVAVAFRLFGESDVVVAITMLALFGAGVIAYARAFGNLAGDASWGRSLAVVLALLPAGSFGP